MIQRQLVFSLEQAQEDMRRKIEQALNRPLASGLRACSHLETPVFSTPALTDEGIEVPLDLRGVMDLMVDQSSAVPCP